MRSDVEDFGVNDASPLSRSALLSSSDKSISAADDALQAVKRGIIRGDFRPGDSVTEGQVATLLNISRTPVREALRELEMQGLLVRRHRRLLVASLSETDAADVRALRSTLETLAIRQAMERCDPAQLAGQLERNVSTTEFEIENNNLTLALDAARAFHSLVYMASGNPMLARFLEQVYDRVDQYRFYTSAERGYSRLRETVAEHKAVIEAIRAGDVDAASRSLGKHLGACHHFGEIEPG